ncbi:MAG: HD domain-containing protein [Rhodothermales bacterium]
MTNLSPQIARQPYAGVLREVGRAAADAGIEAYAVGGVVRDLMLERDVTELDFVSLGDGSGLRLAKAAARRLGGQSVHQYENFGTAAIRIPLAGMPDDAMVLEFVGARKESYRSDSRKPIVEEGSLQDDQRRRDFTINAMGLRLDAERFGEVLDPFGGRADLEAGILRTPLDPHVTFEDDPLRMIRAARFATQLGFTLHADTFQALCDKAGRVSLLSRERITDELQKIMMAGMPSVGFRILYEAGLLRHILPELTDLAGVEAIDGLKHKDNFFHTLQVVDNLVAMTAGRPPTETLWLRWAALLHDIGKTRSKRFTEGVGWSFHGHEDRGARMVAGVFKKLKLPLDDRMRYVQKLVRLHHRPVSLVDEQVTDSAVRRLLFDAGEDIEDLMTLVRADITSKNPRRVQRYLDAFDRVDARLVEVEENDKLRNFQPPVDGIEIMQTLNLPPGKAIGLLKEAVREAILEGVIPNEHDAAFDYLMQIKDAILEGAPAPRS